MKDTSEYDHPNEMITAELSKLGANVLPLSGPRLSANQERIITIEEVYVARGHAEKLPVTSLETTGHSILKPGCHCYSK